MSNILYGGFEGSEEEVCEGTKSLGEALVNKLRTAGQKIVLVSRCFCIQHQFVFPN